MSLTDADRARFEHWWTNAGDAGRAAALRRLDGIELTQAELRVLPDNATITVPAQFLREGQEAPEVRFSEDLTDEFREFLTAKRAAEG